MIGQEKRRSARREKSREAYRRARKRRQVLETLEQRQMLAGDLTEAHESGPGFQVGAQVISLETEASSRFSSSNDHISQRWETNPVSSGSQLSDVLGPVQHSFPAVRSALTRLDAQPDFLTLAPVSFASAEGEQGNPLGALSPADIVATFVRLGGVLDTVSESLDVVGGIPFVPSSISEVADFAAQTNELASNLFQNATVVGTVDIADLSGKLSADASLVIRIEDREPVTVTIPDEATDDNVDLDDLFTDINDAINNTSLAGVVVAERLASPQENRFALRTTDPGQGASLDVSTLQVTANDLAPSSGQLSDDATLTFVVNTSNLDQSVEATVTVNASSTTSNFRLADLVRDLNAAMSEVAIGDDLLGEVFFAHEVDGAIRVSATDSTATSISIRGGEALGFSAEQIADNNSASSELGVGDSLSAIAELEIADYTALVNLINANTPSNTTLTMDTVNNRVTFNLKFEQAFTESIGLDFSDSLSLGFADLNLAGGANADFSVTAGVDLAVGFDLDRAGSGDVIAASDSLAGIGDGVPIKVALTSSAAALANPETLSFQIKRFGQAAETVNVTLSAADLADNFAPIDLAFDLADKLKSLGQPIGVQLGDGDKLVLVAEDDSINQLTATAAAFGFSGTEISDAADLSITLADGSQHAVSLDGAETLGDVQSKIHGAVGATNIAVTFVDDQIQLVDLTTPVNNGRMRIEAASDDLGTSAAGGALGILGQALAEDDSETPQDDRTTIRGDHLRLGDLTDQFFIDVGSSKVYANAAINGSDIDLFASLGFLELGVVGGTTGLTVDSEITFGDNGDGDGLLRLSDFGAVGFPAPSPSFTYGGDFSLPLSIPLMPAESPSVALTLSPGATTADPPALSVNAPNLSDLIGDFQNLSLADLATMVREVVSLLRDSELDGLNSPIPVIDQSPNDLLGFTDDLLRVADQLIDDLDLPVLQSAIDQLNAQIDFVGGTPGQLERLSSAIAGVNRSVREVEMSGPSKNTRLIATVGGLSSELTKLAAEGVDVGALQTTVAEMAAKVASTANLGSLLTELIQNELGLPVVANVEFLDGDDQATGYQPVVKLSLSISPPIDPITAAFDLELGDFGPVTIASGGDIGVQFGGGLDLELGYNFSTLTPYLFGYDDAVTSDPSDDTGTNFTLTAGIDAAIDVTATLGGLEAGLAGSASLHANGNPSADARINVSVNKATVPSDGNTVGGIPLAQLLGAIGSTFTFSLDGEVDVDFDATLPGSNNPVTDAVQLLDFDPFSGVAPSFDFSNLTDGVNQYLASLTDLSSMSLDQMIQGTRTVLDTIENGLSAGVLESLPLIGDGVDLSQSFVGELQNLVDQFESLVNSSEESVDALIGEIQDLIYDNLGPAGANLLSLDPLWHDDPAQDDASEIADSRDVQVTLSDLSSTPPADVEFAVNLNIAGRDVIDADFDFGLDAFVFDFDTSGGVEIAWDYDFDFGFGINLRDGFFFQLNPNADFDGQGFPTQNGGAPEINLNTQVTLKPGTRLSGDLFFLNMDVVANRIEDYNGDGDVDDTLNEAALGIDFNRDGDMRDELIESDRNGDGRFSKGTGLVGDLYIDFDDPSGEGRLSIGELGAGSSLFNAGIQTDAYVDLTLSADTDAGSSLPELTTDLTMDWGIGVNTVQGVVGGGAPMVTFHDVSLDLGSFFESIAGPAFEIFEEYLEPVQPIIDFLRSEVPGFSEMNQEFGSGSKVTFLDLGGFSSSAGRKRIEQAKKVLDILDRIFDAVDTIKGFADADGLKINFGSFSLGGNLTDSNVKPSIVPDAGNTYQSPSSSGEVSPSLYSQASGSGSSVSQLKKLNRSAEDGGLGLSIPILSNPINAFKLLVGDTVELIEWDIPELDIEVGFDARFGPIVIPGIYGKVGGDFGVNLDFSLGFDTRGISETGNFLDGLYFGDLSNVSSGHDVDEVEFDLGFDLGFGIDLGLASVYLVGGADANIGLDFNDIDGGRQTVF